MNFDDIKDKVAEAFANFWGQVQESTLYNNLSERYETATPQAQSLVKAGGVFFVIILLAMIPMSFYSSAGEEMERFERSREDLSNLLKAGPKGVGRINRQQINSQNDLQSKAEIASRGFKVLSEQRGEVRAFNPKDEGATSLLGRASKDILLYGVSLEFLKLNVREINSFAYDLQSNVSGATMLGIEINSNADDDHYFDVVYKLVAFALPVEEASSEDSEKGKGRKKGKKKRSKSKGN